MEKTLPLYKSCTLTESKEKNKWKLSTEEKAEKPRECVFFEQSVIQALKGCDITIANKNWHLLVHQAMEYTE